MWFSPIRWNLLLIKAVPFLAPPSNLDVSGISCSFFLGCELLCCSLELGEQVWRVLRHFSKKWKHCSCSSFVNILPQRLRSRQAELRLWSIIQQAKLSPSLFLDISCVCVLGLPRFHLWWRAEIQKLLILILAIQSSQVEMKEFPLRSFFFSITWILMLKIACLTFYFNSWTLS